MIKRYIIFLCLMTIISFRCFSQISFSDSILMDRNSPAGLSLKDEYMLRSAPILKLNEHQRNIILPSAVNNSENPFMIPIFYQSALECGQASSICYTFSYEIGLNRNYQDLATSFNHRFPSHFVWNFCNGGINTGVSFMDTWEVIRTAGSPMVPDFGGFYNTGGTGHWVSGYDIYYNAMKNRIVEMYAIPTDTEEGILTLKHWIHNHLCGDTYGGLANFYSTYIGSITETLPAGTPHAGMKFLPSFTSSVNHAQTIVAYDDSIRWDYNGDGLYTNDIDLNNDGIINVKDWEIGGVIFCNTFGENFANNGYCYLSYKRLAELPAQGGIWNACVYVVKVKDEVNPALTFKATVKHNMRNQLKITAGVASDINATTPEHTIDFNVFNYQGGEFFMTGGTTENDKTLEFGLDISRLLEFVSPNTPAKFFFILDEDDANNTGTGEIINLSLMDYSGSSVQEHPYSPTPVAIGNNTTTTLSIVQNISFTKPQITDSIIPPIAAYTNFEYQLNATGGTPPYRWEFQKSMNIEEFNQDYPSTAGANVYLSNNDDGYATIPLDFSFPFFDETFNQIVIYADGYITFRHNTYNWPFLKNSDLQIKTTKMIAPFRANLVISNIYKISNPEFIMLSVVGKISGQSNNSVNYSVKLYPDGTIEFYYGNMSYTGTNFISTISRGDSRIFLHTPGSGIAAANLAHRNFRFTPPPKLDLLSLSDDGLLTAFADYHFSNVPVAVTCWDVNDLQQSKNIVVSSTYPNALVITNVQIEANGDNIIHSGDTVSLTITVKNVDTMAYNDCELSFSIYDNNVSFIDNSEYFGYIAPNNEYTLHDAIKFTISNDTPNGYILNFSTQITNSNGFPSDGIFSAEVSGIVIDFLDYKILDNNNNHLLDPMETDTLAVVVSHSGTDFLHNTRFEFSTDDPNILVATPSITIDNFEPLIPCTLSFVLIPNINFVSGTTVDAIFDIYSFNSFISREVISLIGENNCNGFEDEQIPNDPSNQFPWSITTQNVMNGNYAIKSYPISHGGSSSISFTFNSSSDGEVSFYRKVSSETRYDFLHCYLNDIEMDSWAGELNWEQFSYPVEAGENTIRFTYTKDVSVSTNSDCAWIDDVCFPYNSSETPVLQITPPEIEITLPINSEFDTTLIYESINSALLLFTNSYLNTDGLSVNWLSTNYPNGSISPLSSKNITLSINTHNLQPNITYEANLFADVLNGSQVTVPIRLTTQSTGIDSYYQNNYYSAFPNPTTDMIWIKPIGENSPAPISQLMLFDINGKLLISQSADNQECNSINIASLASGFYFLKIIANDSSTQTLKIVKQ